MFVPKDLQGFLNYTNVSVAWYTDTIAGKNFLIRVLGLNDAFSVCMIDFDRIASPSQSGNFSFEPGYLIYYSEFGVPLNNENFLKETGLSLQPDDDSVIKKGNSGNYFVVSQPMKYGNLSMLYITPYRGSIYHMDAAQQIALF